MRKVTNWILATAMASFLLLPLSAEVAAQNGSHVVSIEDGKVFIDGKLIPANELPPSLKINNWNFHSNFIGDALLEIDGIVYQVKDGKLVEADENVARDGRVVVFFKNPEDDDSMVRVLTRNEPFVYRLRKEEPQGLVMQEYMRALHNKAKEFETIREQMEGENGERTYALAKQLQLQAENAARIAESFPRVEFESYLETVQNRNLKLYDELVRERDIETQTHRLAMEARAARTAEQREVIVEELRLRLEEAFELKQQNREQEIEQLASRLEELRDKLDQRADLRNQIIETRLRDLLGELDW